MATDSAYPLTPLLRSLCSFPPPERVAEAVVRGPGGRLGLTTCTIWRLDGVSLSEVSRFGLPAEVEERYEVVPLTVQMPITIAVRENRVIVMPLADMIRDFPAVAMDAEPWQDSAANAATDLAIFSPICAGDLPIGGIAMLGSRDELGIDDYLLVEAIAATLGLWMSNQRSGAIPLRPRTAARPETLSLTERQAQILRLVEGGKSNAQIAIALGFSESTVKQEVQRLLRTLRADTRMSAVERAREVGLI